MWTSWIYFSFFSLHVPNEDRSIDWLIDWWCFLPTRCFLLEIGREKKLLDENISFQKRQFFYLYKNLDSVRESQHVSYQLCFHKKSGSNIFIFLMLPRLSTFWHHLVLSQDPFEHDRCTSLLGPHLFLPLSF